MARTYPHSKSFNYGYRSRGRNRGGYGKFYSRDVGQGGYYRSSKGRYASAKKKDEMFKQKRKSTSSVTALMRKVKEMELETRYGKKTSSELLASRGRFNLYCCGTERQQYYFEVPITSALRTICGSRQSVFVTGAAVSFNVRHLMETRVMLQAFKFGVESGVPLLDMGDRKDGSFPVVNIDGSNKEEDFGLWPASNQRVQKLFSALYEQGGMDGTLFSAPLKDSVTLVSGDVKYGDAKTESHKGVIDKVFYRNTEKGNTLLSLDQTSSDTLRFWVKIDKEISLAQGGDHYTILGAVRAANDDIMPFVDQGEKGGVDPLSYGYIEGMKVKFYYRQ